MRKTLTIALREYRAMVATKALLVSLVMMPLLMFGGLLVVESMERFTRSETLKVAVWEAAPRQYLPLLQAAAEQRNASLQTATESDQPKTNSPLADMTERQKDGPIPDIDRFELVPITGPMNDQMRWEWSEKIRNKQYHALVEIPAGISETDSQESSDQETASDRSPPVVRFYSEASELDPARRWLSSTLNELVTQQRLQRWNIDSDLVAAASQGVEIQSLKPVQQASDGTISTEESKDMMTALLIPMGMMLLMFMVIILSAQPMLESVLEEKSQRIAEVLLGSCNPMQLMTGKLLGTVGGSLTVFLFYLVGGYLFAAGQNYLELVPFEILPWFFVFQLCAVLFYSSIFMAIGSAVSQLKEAQSIMMPVWLMLVLPLMTWFVLVQKPDSGLAFWMSMFPPTAPTVMVLRMSTGTTVPFWQVLLSLALMVLATTFCVYLAGRIFRVGILWQGKAPKLTELVGWAFR